MSNIDFLTVTPEVRELYQFPTDKAVIEQYRKDINTECISFHKKFLNTNYFDPLATVVSLGVFSLSYVYLRQPAGDVARQIKFERMNPLRRAVVRGLPGLSFLAAVYFARQCRVY